MAWLCPTAMRIIAATIIIAEMKKNRRLDTKRKMNEPEKQPIVLKMKYTPVAFIAASVVKPTLSIKICGADVFVPTSIPTWHMIPRKQRSTNGCPNSLKQSTKEDALPSMGCSSIFVKKRKRP